MNIEFEDKIFTISDHALFQYITRFRPDIINQMKSELTDVFVKGIDVKPLDSAIKLMNNGYNPRTYKMLNKKIFVISSDNNVVTVLDVKDNNKKYWIPVKDAKKHEK